MKAVPGAFPVNMREGVIWAFRHLLRREPANEEEVAFHLGHTVATLRDAFASSPEHRALLGLDPVRAELLSVVDRFRPFAADLPGPGTWRNFLGAQTRCSFLPPACLAWSGRVFGPPGSGGISGVHDDAEWLGTLRAILDASQRLTVVELGAGWAPWLVSAAVAARRVGIRELHLLGVEGSVDHVGFMRQHFLDNGIDPAHHRLIHGVVGVEDGMAHFPKLADPSDTYGAEADYAGAGAVDEMEVVPSFSLDTLLAGLPPVDVLHCDIQGMESKVFRAGKAIVNQRVKRVVVGTHGRTVEAELHDHFSAEGWILEADAACQFQQVGATLLLSVDGTQVWRNRRWRAAEDRVRGAGCREPRVGPCEAAPESCPQQGCPRGGRCADSGNPTRAATLYQAVIDRWGPHFGILVQLGNALKDSGAFERAEQVYQAALHISPSDADCHLQLGHLMKLSGHPDRAEAFYIEANRLRPDLEGALVELRSIERSRNASSEEAAVVDVDGVSVPLGQETSRLPAVDRHSRAFVVHQRLLGSLARRRN